MPKRSVRRAMLEHRKSLSEEEFRRASYLIQKAFLASEYFRAAQCVFVYAPIHNEVDTEIVVRCALEADKRVCFPVVVGHEMFFREMVDCSTMKKGAFGILEPCPTGKVVNPEDADVLVLPGVAFDLRGHRIGYGKGYYDKTLHQMEGQGKLVGFCYDFQIVDEIAGQPHDVRMDLIITEERIIYPAAD